MVADVVLVILTVPPAQILVDAITPASCDVENTVTSTVVLTGVPQPNAAVLLYL